MNFWGLDYNTKKRINERIKKENRETENERNLLEMDTEEGEKEDQSSN